MRRFEYVYLGDRWTRGELRGAHCDAVRTPEGKCVRGRNGNMLVVLQDGTRVVVFGRCLRRLYR